MVFLIFCHWFWPKLKIGNQFFWVLSDFFSFGEQPPPNVVTVVRKFLLFLYT